MKQITFFNTLAVAALVFAATACAVPASPAAVPAQPAGASAAAPAAGVVASAVATAAPVSATVPTAGSEPPSTVVPTQTGPPPTPAQTPSTPYWPTQGWRTSTPEAQGLDSAQLAGLFDALHAADARVFSVLVVRHGYLVVEAYFGTTSAGTQREIYSVTKSFTGALVGIAIDEGKLPGVDAKIVELFGGRTLKNLDARKRAMTLDDLLTMRAGLDWPEWGMGYGNGQNMATQMSGAPDWLAFVLDRPMSEEPGTRWNYNSGASHVLLAAVQDATGESALAYAREKLFGPLGIRDVAWYTDRTGRNIGGWGLQMTPRDLAKFGFLYLHGGAWDGRQIVPAAWVKTSTASHAQAFPDKLYGYQWWIRPFGGFSAEGLGGQYVFVLPEQDMVVVTTADLGDLADSTIPPLLPTYVLPAVKGAGPLAENPAAQARLAESIKEATR